MSHCVLSQIWRNLHTGVAYPLKIMGGGGGGEEGVGSENFHFQLWGLSNDGGWLILSSSRW